MQRQRTCRFVSRMVRRSRWSRPETCLTGRRTSVQRLRPLDSWMIVNVAGYSCVGYSASSSNNRRWCGMSESKMSPTRNPLLIENDSPNVTANLWTGRGSAIPFSAKYLPWFFQRGDSIRVFHIVIREKAGKSYELYQGPRFSADKKTLMRKAITQS